ncbi:PAS domain S-box-containing protein [Maribacter arcticus]|uniref:histidine kinase n=2 Tax=Maribacter arcticus TaxID=561365 RepID=A0A1T5AAL7_9FLAO|nr:PAS domain S-box-containing protein [Maribacter arcticus]
MEGNNILDKERIKTLMSFDVMDTLPESIYDDITSLAASICKTPISLISLVDNKRQFFKSHHGLDFNGTSLEDSFCKHIISNDKDLMIVENTNDDERFTNYSLVKENPGVSFYAGASLTASNGNRLGSLCVIDYEARKLSEQQINGLKTLAKQVVKLFELRRSKKNEEDQKIDLERKGKLLENIVKATEIGVWERNIKEDSIMLSDEALQIIGLDKVPIHHFKTNKWLGLIHPEDLAMVKEQFLNCCDYQSVGCEIQYRIMHKNGQFKWVHENGKVLSWNDKQEPLLMYGTLQDITEKVHNRIELERVKNNQEAMINSTKDFMWAIDLDLKLITANTSFHQLIKRNLGHFIKEGDYVISETFNAEINNKWKDFYNRASTGERFSIKHKIKDPSKYLTSYNQTSFNPLYNKESKQIGITCFSKDITSEVLSQQVLLTAKEEMEKIMNASLDIICTIDEEGYFLSINKACKRIWGYEPKDLIGTNYKELVYEEDIALTQDSADSVLAGEKVVNFENRYLHKNKTIVPMLWSSNWDEKDGVIYCVARDITEKKKAELQLENSERRFRTLVQEGSDLIGILDKDANFIYVSPTSTRILNTTPQGFIGNKVFDFVHVDDYEMFYNQFQTIYNKAQITIEPFRFKNKEGKLVWIETIATNKLDDPSINGIILNSKDITEKKKAAVQLEQSEKRFKTLVQEGSDMICIVDEHANFSYASPTSTKILSITPEEFIGTNAFDYVHPDDYETIHNQFIKIFEIPQVTIGPFRFKHGDGNWIWMETIATNKLYEPTINGIVINSKDVTTKVQHLNAIEKQNEQLKKIAWTQSHIVRAPVARLMGLINLIRDEKKNLPFEEKQRILNYIITSADEIDSVIKEIIKTTANAIDTE